MRNLKKGRKLSRKRNQRKALLKSLARALFLKEKIKTTEAKGKELSGFAQKLITYAKKKDLNSSRYLANFFSKDLVKKIVNEIATRYKERSGGYLRIIRVGKRKSDGAKMVILELLK